MDLLLIPGRFCQEAAQARQAFATSHRPFEMQERKTLGTRHQGKQHGDEMLKLWA